MSGTLQGVKLKSTLQPLQLFVHERSVTAIKFNYDGDLIFTASKDTRPAVFYANNGELIGTYDCQKGCEGGASGGSVLDIDSSWDSAYILTGGADSIARMFDALTGRFLYKMNHVGMVNAVAWSESNELYATAARHLSPRQHSEINIFKFPKDYVENTIGIKDDDESYQKYNHLPILTILLKDPEATGVIIIDKPHCMAWGVANKFILVGTEQGYIYKYDPKTGDLLAKAKIHDDKINCLNFNKEKTLFITGSKDTTAKLINPETLKIIKTYFTEKPVNGAVISDLHPHVIVGGGQDAREVTTTKASSGQFESRIYHMIYEQEFGRIGGHFGPINAIAIHPQGTAYVSGAEDGLLRVHHFDDAYIKMSDMIPSENYKIC